VTPVFVVVEKVLAPDGSAIEAADEAVKLAVIVGFLREAEVPHLGHVDGGVLVSAATTTCSPTHSRAPNTGWISYSPTPIRDQRRIGLGRKPRNLVNKPFVVMGAPGIEAGERVPGLPGAILELPF
jgi:hypothetical protein